MRDSRTTTYMKIARVISLRGTCLRAKVGVVATVDNRIVAMGYNGSLPGEDHCSGDTCTPEAPCLNSVHAEANMIAFCARKGIALEGATVYLTHSPCRKCSELLIQVGVHTLWYYIEYRDTPWDLFKATKINVCHYEDHILYSD